MALFPFDCIVIKNVNGISWYRNEEKKLLLWKRCKLAWSIKVLLKSDLSFDCSGRASRSQLPLPNWFHSVRLRSPAPGKYVVTENQKALNLKFAFSWLLRSTSYPVGQATRSPNCRFVRVTNLEKHQHFQKLYHLKSPKIPNNENSQGFWNCFIPNTLFKYQILQLCVKKYQRGFLSIFTKTLPPGPDFLERACASLTRRSLPGPPPPPSEIATPFAVCQGEYWFSVSPFWPAHFMNGRRRRASKQAFSIMVIVKIVRRQSQNHFGMAGRSVGRLGGFLHCP